MSVFSSSETIHSTLVKTMKKLQTDSNISCGTYHLVTFFAIFYVVKNVAVLCVFFSLIFHLFLAVIFECIKTVTAIYPIKSLLDLAAKKTTYFLTSNCSNLKCLGKFYYCIPSLSSTFILCILTIGYCQVLANVWWELRIKYIVVVKHCNLPLNPLPSPP